MNESTGAAPLRVDTDEEVAGHKPTIPSSTVGKMLESLELQINLVAKEMSSAAYLQLLVNKIVSDPRFIEVVGGAVRNTLQSVAQSTIDKKRSTEILDVVVEIVEEGATQNDPFEPVLAARLPNDHPANPGGVECWAAGDDGMRTQLTLQPRMEAAILAKLQEIDSPIGKYQTCKISIITDKPLSNSSSVVR